MNPSKIKGTAWETAITRYLRACGWTYAERRSLNGSKDRGDIAGIPGVVIEAKATKTVALGAYLDEANTEALNDGANVGAVWLKRRGVVHPADGYVVMDGSTFVGLLHAAGYGGSAELLHDATEVPL
jgi:hypothetical protein